MDTVDFSNIFFISDFHFDHGNIIKYCNRPFLTTEDMNEEILKRYNEVVKDDSTIYFLGDMSFGRNSRKPKWWLEQLKGNITYIKGSHDHGLRPTNLRHCYEELILEVNGHKLLLTHEPRNTWPDWNIYGHTHSKDMVDSKHRRICVCVEAVDYRPISLKRIMDLIEGGN